MEGDRLLALQLQAAWEKEEGDVGPNPAQQLSAPPSVVDEEWELIDPNPDLHGLFLQFNELYFWGRLAGVEVRWSPRMTLCAGVCSYEGRGGLCSIRISEPLLKLRPRRDLVETLLHEMIHALLFVTNNDKDHESHGPEFCKHMRRINRMSGANVTIYHNFHDEVDEYRQHWWRCDGPCQNRRPYFGYVKRAMNRAPSARDPWWAEHQQTCGGAYTKVKEPENYKVKKGKCGKTPGKPKDGVKSPGVDIRSVIPFNGKGHVLGGRSMNSPSQRTPLGKIPESSKLLSPPSQFVSLGDGPGSGSWAVESNQQRRTPQAANSFDPMPLGAGSPCVLTGWLLKSPNNRTSPKTPKKSVSNNRAFVSINGSPVKIGRTKSMNSVKETVPKSSQKRPVSEMHRDPQQSSQSATGTSTRKKVCDELSVPRGSIISAFDKSPAHRQGNQSAAAGATDSNNWHSWNGIGITASQIGSPTGNTSISTGSVPVNCPVCQSAILPSEINQHLDSCLQ
ncbi:DNA-dependent metalloprotease SPRTN [Carcharodon carcharias]|uniref:DNA-dependent metalloprotease SPRTN n=1 Tax=Carcharodon carcharias TaxID=13397 RepID=UPI001B7E93B7|nr:DNA-dependent metalloprotease SPRTN [Carcharodon carcharias]